MSYIIYFTRYSVKIVCYDRQKFNFRFENFKILYNISYIYDN